MKILFICTHNRCRSILAEAIANYVGEGEIIAASAGSEPASEVYPLTLSCLREQNIPTKSLYSKSWDAMEEFDPDLVISVCHQAAGQRCPVWFGMAMQAHWDIGDPSSLNLSEEEKLPFFHETIELLKTRLLKFKAFLDSDPDRTAILHYLQQLEHGSV